MPTLITMIPQIFLYLVNALSVHVSLSPPNPPVKRQECCTGTPETDTIFERVVQRVTYLTKASTWVFTLVNIIGTISWHQFAFYPCSAPEKLSSSMGKDAISSVHPILIFGATITLISALLRLWCYKTLGSFFTFEITIRPKHELITHGPYAYVRHPSYTGVHLTLIGSTCCLLAPGTCTSDYCLKSPLGILFLTLWLLKCSFAFRGMSVRYKAEDDLLRANFGEEWEGYARRVPFKFVPGVY